MQKSLIPYWLQSKVIQQVSVILQTYQKTTGSELFDPAYSGEYRSYLLYHAPFVVISHGTEEDPVFNYANYTAQQLWNLDWEDFVKLPSKHSAEPERLEDRQRLLDTASKQGYVDNYEGIRTASDGKRFRIQNVLLWNLMDDAGERIGQAAFFRSWTNL